MNTITILGHLGHDVSIKTLESGKIVGEFSVGQSEHKRKGADNKPHVNWFRVNVFDELANNCKNYLGKGSQVLVMGTLNIAKYSGKDGIEKTAVTVFANTVKFLDSKKGGAGEIATHKDPIKRQEEKQDFSGVTFDDNNDLPF